ncbi:hypothetical protein D6D21_10766 [Aureobasidium pullulans]|uniref:Transcription factor domain-containing protein n=1 Tax=Aureobasidium pullulans TaxID=5580 RepID=A0AB74IGW0_AURPU|nr:hypothetical protein D6D21_10766 [Aureobasidium pullulans]
MSREGRIKQQKRKHVDEEIYPQQTKRPRSGETQLNASSAHSENDFSCSLETLEDIEVTLFKALLPEASYAGQTSSPWPALFDGASSARGASDDNLLRNVSFDDASTLSRDSPARIASPNSSPDTVYSCDEDQIAQQSPHPQIMINQNSADTWTSKIGESQQAFTIYSSSTITQRKYKGPSSHQAFAQWFQLNSHVLDKDLSEHFRQGLRHSEEMDMPPFLSMLALCPDWEVYVDAYLDEVAPIYPIVGREIIVRAGTYLARSGALEHNLWSDNLPESLRPRRGLVNYPQRLLAFRTVLSFNFHHALIALHRTALIGDFTGSVATSERHDSKPHNARRLERSEGICANSARDILTTYLAFIEQKKSSPLITLNQPLLAVHLLTIYNLKYPDAWSAEADLQLLSLGIEAIKKAYEAIGLPASFCSMLDTLRQAARRHEKSCTSPTPPSRQQEGPRTSNSEHKNQVAQVRELSFDVANVDGYADQLGADPLLKSGSVGDDPGDVLMGSWLDTPHLLDEEILDFDLWAGDERTDIAPQAFD